MPIVLAVVLVVFANVVVVNLVVVPCKCLSQML